MEAIKAIKKLCSFQPWNQLNIFSKAFQCAWKNAPPQTFDENDMVNVGDTLPGLQKYYAGVCAPNSKIYCCPASATNVLVIDTATDTTYTIGNFSELPFKWGFGCLHPNGLIYFAAKSSNDILVINPTSDTISYINTGLTGLDKFHSIKFGKEGNLYLFPQRPSNSILQVDISTNIKTAYPIGLSSISNVAFLSVSEAFDGCFYMLPTLDTNIVKFNPVSKTITLINISSFGFSQKWGSTLVAPNGKIYGIPYSYGKPVVLNLQTNILTDLTGTSITGGFKYSGGVVLSNGKIYAASLNRQSILEINTNTDTFQEISNVNISSGGNKYIDAVLAINGNIYLTPYNASKVLKIGGVASSQNPNFILNKYII